MKLDRQYKYLHIDLSGKDKPDVYYDSLATLYDFCALDKKIGIFGLFEEILNSNGVELDAFDLEIDDPKIIWMDYRENYLNSTRPLIEDEDDDDDNEDDEHRMPRIFNMGMFNGDQFEITPWGKFTESDPMNPMNLYEDIHVMHFKGFDFSHMRGLTDSMNNIEGVAKWCIIDKYSAIVCVAKAYTSVEVKKNIEDTIYSNLNHRKFSELEESALEAMYESQELEEDNIILVFPNGEKKTILNPSPKDIIEVDNLLSNVQNCVAFKNGDIYESRKPTE
jgi:hypothetical protein